MPTFTRKHAHRPIQRCQSCDWFDSGVEFHSETCPVPCPRCGKHTQPAMGRFIDTIRTYFFGLIKRRTHREVQWWYDPINEVPPE